MQILKALKTGWMANECSLRIAKKKKKERMKGEGGGLHELCAMCSCAQMIIGNFVAWKFARHGWKMRNMGQLPAMTDCERSQTFFFQRFFFLFLFEGLSFCIIPRMDMFSFFWSCHIFIFSDESEENGIPFVWNGSAFMWDVCQPRSGPLQRWIPSAPVLVR